MKTPGSQEGEGREGGGGSQSPYRSTICGCAARAPDISAWCPNNYYFAVEPQWSLVNICHTAWGTVILGVPRPSALEVPIFRPGVPEP